MPTRWRLRTGRGELIAFIAGLDRFQEAVGDARRRGRPLRAVGDRPVRATSTVRLRWPMRQPLSVDPGTVAASLARSPEPGLDDLADLARFLELDEGHLDWFADRRGLNRRAGVHTFAAPHAGQRTVVRVDLVSFFASITAARVYGLWRTAGFPEPVAHALAALCTTRTPAAVLWQAPAALDQRAYRVARLRGAHLPQGAPTSPALANLCGYRLDRRLAGLAGSFDLRYSRYADDLAFSGDLSKERATALVGHVAAIAADEGFRVHPAKVRIRGQGDRQLLAGLVVNQAPAVNRAEYDRLRAVLHDAARHGLDAANRAGRPNFGEYLAGRVAWVGHRHPARAAKLRGLLAGALDGRG